MTDKILLGGKPVHILLVEDNRGDVLLMQRAFNEGSVETQITVANSGEQALEVLGRQGEFEGLGLPDLVLLDLNLPRMSGQDVLVHIKQSPHYKHIPVIVLSSSKAEQDVLLSYNLHANSYICKPDSSESFSVLVKRLEQFWFTLAMIPKTSKEP